MNARGAKLAAEILFDKLKPLINYQDLSRWHRAYDLRELLEVNGLPSQFNSLFSELDTSPINIKNEKEKMIAWSDQDNYYIVRTRIDTATGRQKFLRRLILERDGKVVKSERKTFHPFNGSLIRHEITDALGKKIIQTIKTPKMSNQHEFIETKKTYLFAYHSEYRKDLGKFIWELEIEENTRFFDPLTLEAALFFRERYRLGRLDNEKLRKALEFYISFPFYAKGSGVGYVQKLLDDILRFKPFKKSDQFVEGFKKSISSPGKIH